MNRSPALSMSTISMISAQTNWPFTTARSQPLYTTRKKTRVSIPFSCAWLGHSPQWHVKGMWIYWDVTEPKSNRQSLSEYHYGSQRPCNPMLSWTFVRLKWPVKIDEIQNLKEYDYSSNIVILVTKSYFGKYIKEKCWSEVDWYYPSFKYFNQQWLVLKLFSKWCFFHRIESKQEGLKYVIFDSNIWFGNISHYHSSRYQKEVNWVCFSLIWVNLLLPLC